jgi:hypothetical protein
MKFAKYLALVATLVLLAPLGALAANKNEHNVNIPEVVQVGSTQLQPGDYKVEWQGTGPAVHVKFLKDGKSVATTQGKIVESAKASPYDDVITRTTKNHQKRIEEIDFGNKRESLMIAPHQMGTK